MAERSTGARQSDEEILAALDAAPDAFAVFYRRHVADLLRYLDRCTQDPALAADLCAETFAAALDSAHRLDTEPGSAAARLYTIADSLLAHVARRGTAQDRARLRLGMASLEPPRDEPASVERFVADLEDELVAAARYRTERRAHRPPLPPLRGVLAGVAALALAAIVAALLLRGGDGDTAAGERSAASLPPSVRFRLLPMQPLAPCPEPAPHPVGDAAAVHRIALLGRPQGSADELPFAARMLPIGTFDPRSTRRATHTRLWSAVHVVPSLDVAPSGECGSHVGRGLCLAAEEREFRCFTAVDVEWGRAVARTTGATLVGIVPDGVERVTIRGFGPPVGAEVVDNVYEVRNDVPAGLGVQVVFDQPQGDGCRRAVAPQLVSEVALLGRDPRPDDELPEAAHEALEHWGLDAVVQNGARYWGGEGAVGFWAVPVVPRGGPDCAPASRVCIVVVGDGSSAAQCMLGRNRGGQNWWLGGPRSGAVIFGTVPDGVTGVRVKHGSATADVDARANVFGGALPFPYRERDRTRVEFVR